MSEPGWVGEWAGRWAGGWVDGRASGWAGMCLVQFGGCTASRRCARHRSAVGQPLQPLHLNVGNIVTSTSQFWKPNKLKTKPWKLTIQMCVANHFNKLAAKVKTLVAETKNLAGKVKT